ncbi:ATP-binding protein [Parabacteroides sp. OttesenSCG-928-N08]|nr:ATP-binding protein [Parabacteroides sp. OttesenSCG-928-N08]
MEKKLVIKNEISEISHLATFVEEVGEALDLSPALVMSLNLVLEEAVSNVILYAYPKPEGEEVTIEAKMKEDYLVFIITDNGQPFDPTQVAEADITLSAEERPIGGLGIFLIKKIMNEIEYNRIDGNNVFTLKKKLEN